MRELEYLASLHLLRAIETGGLLEDRPETAGRVISVIDPSNGFLHWIDSTKIANYSWRWDERPES